MNSKHKKKMTKSKYDLVRKTVKFIDNIEIGSLVGRLNSVEFCFLPYTDNNVCGITMNIKGSHENMKTDINFRKTFLKLVKYFHQYLFTNDVMTEFKNLDKNIIFQLKQDNL
jgi:hypothetical protein